jgi:NADPH2:quinone reductase
VRAALVHEYGSPPGLGELEELERPDGHAIVELLAAALNPADLAIASGRFPAGSPPLPYVPGIEGVGRVVESARFAPGTRVWAMGRGLGVARNGAFAERFAVSDDALTEVPEGADDVLAVAFATVGVAAWLPLSWLAPVRPDDVVLVLGATGAVGTVAVQSAKLLGARRVIAAGRDAERLERAVSLGADAAVELDGDGLADRLVAAGDGAQPTLVFDLLWGPPIEAATAAAAAGARIAHVGQSAGPTATIASGYVRGKQLEILGYSNFTAPSDAVAKGYAEVVGHAVSGRLRLDVETVPLDRIAEAWERQASRRDVKLVLVP